MPSKAELSNDTKALIYGLTLHGIFSLAFALWVQPKALPPAKKTYSSIELQLKTKKKTPPKPIASKDPSSPAGSPAVRSSSPTAASSPKVAAHSKGATIAINSYSDLLPSSTTIPSGVPTSSSGPDNGPSFAKNAFNENVTGKERQDLMLAAGTLVTAIDVPLEARKNAEPGQAFATLVYDHAKQALNLKSLYGQATLRAVLYERLQEKNVQIVIREIMGNLGSQELRIFLHSINSYDAAGAGEENYKWKGNRLDIFKVIAHQRPGMGVGSMSLPDAEAEKAVLWDKAANAKIRGSPAYDRAIQDKILCEHC